MDALQIYVFLSLTQALVAGTMAAVALLVRGLRLPLPRGMLVTSLASLALFGVLSNLSLWMSNLGPTWVLARTLASVGSLVAIFLHAAFLAFALHVGLTGESLARGPRRLAVAAALLITLALILPGTFDAAAASTRNLLRVGGRAALMAMAYGAITAIAIHHLRRHASAARWLLVAALGILLLGSAINAAPLFDAAGGIGVSMSALTAMSQVLGLVGLMTLALGLLIWTQEHMQAAAEAQAIDAERLALFDHETGLPNRTGLLRRIEAERSDEAMLTVMVVRLHRQAQLERTLGSTWVRESLNHWADALVADQTTHWLAVARIGSDRLAMAMPAGGAAAEADVALRFRAVEAVAQSLGHPVTLSAGYALRQHGEAAETLLASACLAQEKAELGGMPMLRFEREQARLDAEEIALLGALYRALGEDQLFLEFEGIFDARSLEVRGVEALLRWHHPTRGELSPGQFLPVAERGGLMADIDAWVLRRLCAILKDRLDQGLPAVPVAMNLSSASLLDAGLPAKVAKQLHDHGLPSRLLELEITESAAMHDLERAARIVDALRDIGVRIALDDLGTGYSSLAHLRDLHADRLKIDRSFMAAGDRVGQAIATAIGALGRSLDLEVVAEGIETTEQLAFCRDQGIDHVQGWLFRGAPQTWPAPPEALLPTATAAPV